VLYLLKVRVDHSKLSTAELWDLWEKEIEADEGAMDPGKIKTCTRSVASAGSWASSMPSHTTNSIGS
jgi:hypothetical protein